MSFAERISDVVGFVRDRPRLAAAAAVAFLAMVAPVWWLVPQRGEFASSRADKTKAAASPRVPARVWVPPPVPAPQRVELCGPGPAPVADDNPAPPSDMESPAESATDSALDSLATDLAARSTDRERALGLYLQTVSARVAARDQQEKLSAAAESQGALVQLAKTTSDGNAYALAIFSCMPLGHTGNGDCDVLSYAQWATLEPNNAVPWLYLAANAEGRLDQRAAEAALYQASKARYSDMHLDQILGLVTSSVAAALSPNDQFELTGSLLSIRGGLPHPNLFVVAHYCGVATRLDPYRAQTCGDLAAMLIQQSRTAVEVLMGGRVAERVGWTDPRLASLRDEADAMRWRLLTPWFTYPQQQAQEYPGCDSLQRVRLDLVAEMQLGEAGRLRQDLSAVGLTTAEAAERWRGSFAGRMSRSR